jgi:DNA-binding transcriptional ArsR family regulator
MDSHLVAQMASMVGDPARAAMICSLLDGESRPASELALIANVSAQTTSNHLRLLASNGILRMKQIGRNRFYELRDASVASAVEALAGIPHTFTNPRTLASRHGPELVFARTCYDHLAGELSVAILECLRSSGQLVQQGPSFSLTPAGNEFFNTLGIPTDAKRGSRRRFACPCMDWSQRKAHLGGALGADLLTWMQRSGFITPSRKSRTVLVTEKGVRGLEHEFAIRFRKDRLALV